MNNGARRPCEWPTCTESKIRFAAAESRSPPPLLVLLLLEEDVLIQTGVRTEHEGLRILAWRSTGKDQQHDRLPSYDLLGAALLTSDHS